MNKVSFQIRGNPLIKFQSSEKILSLSNGFLYANTLSYYRKREEETGDMTVGDRFEAMLHVNEGYIHIPSTGEVVSLNDSLLHTSHDSDYVFCMFGIYPSNNHFEFSAKQKHEMLTFGDTALVILDSEEFIRRVIAAAQNAGYICRFDYVKYYDPSIDNAEILLSLLQDYSNIAFWKRDAYIYQQEARFVFYGGDMTKDHLELQIGDISDIVAVIPSAMALTGVSEKSDLK